MKKSIITLASLLLSLTLNPSFAAPCPYAEPTSKSDAEAVTKAQEAVIEAVLSKLPAETPADYDALMQELAEVGKTGVEILAGKLHPASDGQNSTVEYALNGLVAYVSAEGREALADEVRDGLRSAIDLCNDKVNKGFLMTLLQLLGRAEDAGTYVKYINDDYLKPFAISGLIALQGDEKAVSKLIRKSRAYDEGLAYLASKKNLPYPRKSSEKVDGADDAQELMNSGNSHERINGLCKLMESGEPSPRELVLEALRDEDREYRAAALMLANDFADEAFYEQVASLLPELKDEAKADVVNWFGDNHVTGQSGSVVKETASTNPQLAKAAIKAAGKIGGDDALKALETCMDGPYGKDAVTALTSFKADVTEVVMKALEGSPRTQVLGLELAAARHVTASVPKVFELTGAEDAELSETAYKSLAGVCTTEDFENLRALYDSCGGTEKAAVRDAIVVSVQGLSDEAVTSLVQQAYSGSETAFIALVNIHKDLTSDLLTLAEQNGHWRDDALLRICALMDEYVPRPERAALITKSLALQPSSDVQKKLLNTLGDSHDPAGIEIALLYIGTPETAESAAYAIKTIAGKNADLLSKEEVRAALLKARDVYSFLSTINADAGYAVDEINGMLSK